MTVARIKKQSDLSHMEIMHLIKLARETDFDLEHEVDWDQGYEAAKAKIEKGRLVKDIFQEDY